MPFDALPKINWRNPQSDAIKLCAPMSEGAGPMLDVTFLQAPLVPTGNPTVTFDSNGRMVVVFDGVDDLYTGTPGPVAFLDNTPFTVVFWAKTSDAGNLTVCGTWDYNPTSGGSAGWNIRILAGLLHITLSTANASAFRLAHGNVSINDGKDHRLVCTYSGNGNTTGMKFYVDGVQMTTVSDSNTSPGTLANTMFKIGYLSSSSPQRYIGTLRDLRCHAKEFTALDVSYDYNEQTRESLYLPQTPDITTLRQGDIGITPAITNIVANAPTIDVTHLMPQVVSSTSVNPPIVQTSISLATPQVVSTSVVNAPTVQTEVTISTPQSSTTSVANAPIVQATISLDAPSVVTTLLSVVNVPIVVAGVANLNPTTAITTSAINPPILEGVSNVFIPEPTFAVLVSPNQAIDQPLYSNNSISSLVHSNRSTSPISDD